jgi:hypothetical protein
VLKYEVGTISSQSTQPLASLTAEHETLNINTKTFNIQINRRQLRRAGDILDFCVFELL